MSRASELLDKVTRTTNRICAMALIIKGTLSFISGFPEQATFYMVVAILMLVINLER